MPRISGYTYTNSLVNPYQPKAALSGIRIPDLSIQVKLTLPTFATFGGRYRYWDKDSAGQIEMVVSQIPTKKPCWFGRALLVNH